MDARTRAEIDAAWGKVRASGRTDGIGSFVLSTYGQEDGAPPGKYKVIVAVSTTREEEPGVLEPVHENEGASSAAASPVPAKYSNPQTTSLLFEVTEAGPNEFTIDLK